MNKSLARNLFLGFIAFYIVGIVLTVAGANNSGLQAGGLGLDAIGGILFLVAWIGSLIKTAQLSRWGWFVGILLTGAIGLLVYVIGGPTAKRA